FKISHSLVKESFFGSTERPFPLCYQCGHKGVTKSFPLFVFEGKQNRRNCYEKHCATDPVGKMMGKEYRQLISLFTVILVALNFLISGSAAESQKHLVRHKRNIICFFGLTGFISDMFYEALQSIDKLDPLVLGSLLDGKLQDATLQGLSTLRNDSNIDTYCQDDIVILSTLMSLSDVTFSFEWSQKILFTFSGTVTATVEDIQFQLESTFNMDDGIVLDVNVELTELGDLNLGFSGLGPLNLVIKLIGNIVLNIFQHEISKKIETVLKSTFQSELNKF
ncbi:unnamed protein product, partial [Larinioides sclopetarius]